MTWNFADIWEGIASIAGDEPALLHDDRCLSWTEFDRRSNAIARHLIESGTGPGDKVAIYSYNRPEWLEGLAGIFKARCVPVNVNYRYRDEELAYILENSDAVAMLFEAGFARSVDALRSRLPMLTTLIELADGEPSSSWATGYEIVVSGACEPLGLERNADDLLFMYTGGTTGVPKGVMWRQEDLWQTLGGGGDLVTGSNRPRDLAQHLEGLSAAEAGPRLLPACPLMHGTGQFTAIHALAMGGSIVTLPSHRFDAHELWEQVESKSVNIITIVGDVFARPMIKALEEKSYRLDSLRMIISSGVMWTPETKEQLLDHHPAMALVDSFGSSEATGLGVSVQTADTKTETARFKVGDKVKVITDDNRVVRPGSGERGRVARCGPIPLGYYKDPEKTAKTFPVVDGVRYAMPGDYATVLEDGALVLLGRGSQCINTGGEKVFPEEVEEVLKRFPPIVDAAVVGLPDDDWGQAVTALVQTSNGDELEESAVREHVRGALANFKVPKKVFTVASLGRSPAGKIDYKAITDRALELCAATSTPGD